MYISKLTDQRTYTVSFVTIDPISLSNMTLHRNYKGLTWNTALRNMQAASRIRKVLSTYWYLGAINIIVKKPTLTWIITFSVPDCEVWDKYWQMNMNDNFSRQHVRSVLTAKDNQYLKKHFLTNLDLELNAVWKFNISLLHFIPCQ